MVADKAQTYCPRLEGLVPGSFENRICLDNYELLNRIRNLKLGTRNCSLSAIGEARSPITPNQRSD